MYRRVDSQQSSRDSGFVQMPLSRIQDNGILNNGRKDVLIERPSVREQLQKPPVHTPKPHNKGKDSPALE